MIKDPPRRYTTSWKTIVFENWSNL